MRQFLTALATFCLMFVCSSTFGQNLTFYPEHPTPGQEVVIKYNPVGTPLEGMDKFETTAFFFEGKLPIAKEVVMHLKGDVFKGSITTSENTKALFVKLSTEDGTKDDNGEKGYGTKMYNADGKPVAGARANKALALGTYNRYVNVKRDREKALKYMMKEFEVYPESKKDANYLRAYASLATATKNDELVADVEGVIASLVKNKKATEEDLSLAYQLASTLRNEEQVAAIKERTIKKYPKGKLVAWGMMDEFYQEKDLEKKVAIYEKFVAAYGQDETYKGSVEDFSRSLASLYGRNQDWANFDKYIAKMTDNTKIAGAYNSVAWVLCGEGIEQEATKEDVARAAKYSGKSLELLEKDIMTPENSMPETMTPTQWKRYIKRSYGMYADTYAVTMYRTENYIDALKYQQIASDLDKFHDAEMNSRYCIYLEKAKGAEAAEKMLEKMISKGTANSTMKAHYKELYLANNTLESAFDKYMVALESKAKEQMKEDLKKKMIDLPAPDFALVNLKGETVSAADLKGKVVVVDFWATWCGPCKASFPGMQRAVNNYADNPNVAFVFVDTWERSEDKRKNAADFIDKHDYTFNVLLDEKDEVVAKFGVTGIPTKFILDKEGKIRFRSSGFSGNDDELVDELTMMIEMAADHSSTKMTGAP